MKYLSLYNIRHIFQRQQQKCCYIIRTEITHILAGTVGSPLSLVSAVVQQSVPAHCLSDKQFTAKNTLSKNRASQESTANTSQVAILDRHIDCKYKCVSFLTSLSLFYHGTAFKHMASDGFFFFSWTAISQFGIRITIKVTL